MTIDDAVPVLLRGGVIGLPTDTVYGLAALATSAKAVERLFSLKGRPSNKPIALLVASVEEASMLVEFNQTARDLADRYWPGALTIVLNAAVPLPEWVGDGGRTVGVRMPAWDSALELLGRVGPLAVTSANVANGLPARNDFEARALFSTLVDGYITGTCPSGLASTVVDATGEKAVILRPGQVSL